MSRRRSPAVALVALLVAGVLVCVPACGSDPTPVDDGVLHAVMLGTDEVLDERGSDAVDAIGLRLRALGPSFAAVVGTSPGSSSEDALDAFDADVAALADEVADAPALVDQGFAAYVEGWRSVATSERVRLTSDDPAAAAVAAEATGAAVARLQELDAARLARVAAAFGENEAARLLGLERSP